MRAETYSGISLGIIWGTITKYLDIPSLAGGVAFVASTFLAGLLGAAGAHVFKLAVKYYKERKQKKIENNAK